MISSERPIGRSESESVLDRIRELIFFEFGKNNLRSKEIEEIAQSILAEVRKPKETSRIRTNHDDMECL